MKKLLKQLLRKLGIDKPIKLSASEIVYIKLCKLHYKDDPRFKDKTGTWVDFLKIVHMEHYGWDPNDHYDDFLDCMIGKLFEIYMKIALDESGSNIQLMEIIKSGYAAKPWRVQEKPQERIISTLCGVIQNNLVIKEGVPRYILN
jgi:hypothetical protein